MTTPGTLSRIGRILTANRMLPVLLFLCLIFSVLTYGEQEPEGAHAARLLAGKIVNQFKTGAKVLIAAPGQTEKDAVFAEALGERLRGAGVEVVAIVRGNSRDAAVALKKVSGRLDVIACTRSSAGWGAFDDLSKYDPAVGAAQVMIPPKYHWPTFLNPENLLNILSGNTVVALLAIGMTVVIISGGIDLSVASLVAFSTVVTTLLIRDRFGGPSATVSAMVFCSVCGILACGLVGLVSGTLVAWYRSPPFLVTLGMMMVVRGIAFRLTRSNEVSQIPDSFVWLGGGVSFLNIPNAVVLVVALFFLAQFLLNRTVLGRYLYAVGGNSQAAYLSGIPVGRVLIFSYVCSGLLSGLGGVVLASRLKSGSATYAETYELFAIAAVVVGGTRLDGGEGNMFGTVIGVLIMAVIQNGMNLMNIDPITQKIIPGAVILGAVLLDALQRRRWKPSWRHEP